MVKPISTDNLFQVAAKTALESKREFRVAQTGYHVVSHGKSWPHLNFGINAGEYNSGVPF
jgi:hypothetical protein